MRRGLILLVLGALGGASIAQEASPPDYTKAEISEAVRSCLEAIRELEANTQRYPIEEFGELLPNATPNELLTRCVVYRLENGDAEVIPLA